MKWGDFQKYLEIAPFSCVFLEKKYKKNSRISYLDSANQARLVHNCECRRSRVFLEDSLWPMNSEAKGPLHMILTEAYFNATRQQPMEPGL